MRRSLVALAVAAASVISGSAMAWTANGTGGSVDLSGTLIPQGLVTPWEVKTGTAVTGLDADIEKGQRIVDVAVDNAIPVLGIRTVSQAPFQGSLVLLHRSTIRAQLMWTISVRVLPNCSYQKYEMRPEIKSGF